MKVILHAPTAGALARARANLRNLLIAQPDAEVRIVVNAAGIPAAIDHPDSETDQHLCLCENGLRNNGLDAPDDITTVPAAVEEMVTLQAEGWTYLRA